MEVSTAQEDQAVICQPDWWVHRNRVRHGRQLHDW